MDFTLSSDQKLFRATTCELLDKSVPLSKVRDLGAAGTGFERGWWSQGAELGWLSMLADKEFGGDSISGSGLTDMAIVAEEMGRRVSPGSLAMANALIAGISGAANAAEHAETVENAMAGQTVLAWAALDPGSPWAPTVPKLAATVSGSEMILHGQKTLVESADQADVLVVTAATDDGPAQFVVPVGTPGLSITDTPSLDIVRRFADVTFDQVRVPAAARLLPKESTETDIRKQLQIVLALQSAETVGALTRTLEFTTQWAFDRYSFGRPLASYQALKHRFADMHTWLQVATATTDAAVEAVSTSSSDADELVSIAKAYIGPRSTDIVQDCVQLHGGIGVTWEHDIHLYLRRVTVNRNTFGTPNDHLQAVATILNV